MFMEFASALSSGWVTEVFVENNFRFHFIGFDFLQHLHGPGMYAYYVVACIVSAMVALGLLYRPASILLAIMWTAVYFSQKGHYNNHYYLMMLLCWLMTLVPANRRAALDTKLGLVKPADTCLRWHLSLFVIQTAIVYTYASIAKIYPDWLQAMPVKLWFSRKTNHPYFGSLFSSEAFAYIVAYSGILFDLLIVPALLWRRTRVLAVVAMLVFHQFNKLTFGIGVFPYLAMSLNVFFFPGKTFDNTVGLVREAFQYPAPVLSKQRLVTILLSCYILWQLLTPFRHHLIEGDVLWTEEGHRMSWRMMLRSKKGDATFTIKDKLTDSTWTHNPEDELYRYQARGIATKPDFIWQYARHLKQEYKKQGIDVGIYVKSYCSVNGRPMKLLVDTTVDIGSAEWKLFAHNKWVTTEFK